MKKYFLIESGKEVKFGDRIQLDLVDDLSNGHQIHKHLDCKFHPMLVDMLEEQGFIRVVDDSSKQSNVKSSKEEEVLLKRFEKCDSKMEELEDRLTELEGVVAKLLYA